MKAVSEHHNLEQAALWFARQDDASLSPADQLLFDQWLAENVGHRIAYQEISGIWYEAAELEKPLLRDNSNVVTLSARTVKPRLSPGLRYQWQAAAAAVIVAVLGLSGGYIYDVPTRLQADAYTTTGENRIVALPDGSTAELNTSSALEIRFTDKERVIRLLKGEALFIVAPDKTRPFRVLTKEGEATALGTVYNVQQEKTQTTVTVLESKVALQTLGQTLGQNFETTTDHGTTRAVLNANEQAHFTANAVSAIQTVDAESITAWRRGKLIVNDRPLGEVITELNRYHKGMIRISDSALDNLRVSGVFETKDTTQVVQDLEKAMHLRSTRISNYLILLHR